MLPKHTSMISLAGALLFAGMTAAQTMKAHEAMQSKAQAQQEAVEDFQRWKRQYTELLPIDERWRASFKTLAEARDLYSIHRMLGDRPVSNPDTFIVERIEPLTFESTPMRAWRVCVSSTDGQGGLRFVEPGFALLFQGLDQLAERPDIQMNGLAVSYDKGQATAVVQGLCLILRDSGEEVSEQ